MDQQHKMKTANSGSFIPVSRGLLQRRCACGKSKSSDGECPECKKSRSPLQRRSSHQTEPTEVPPIVQEVLTSPGQPLEPSSRVFMESRFGCNMSQVGVHRLPASRVQSRLSVGQSNDRYEQNADRVAKRVLNDTNLPSPQALIGQATNFSDVKIHTDSKAAESARAVNALAYTVGNHIVFGKDQYAPLSNRGKNLLAHELTHVLQQNTLTLETGVQSTPSSGVLQRTPAPPNYGGVTGTRDLSKIRIDAVADFVASSLTAPLAVNVHINDPSVNHISWIFYDPNDQMMSGSYSTLPGFPNSTSRPFQLRPSHFSGAGFVAGKYILRCIGMNNNNQPVIYADRDFNVLRSDLTTGTALATTYGNLKFTKYKKTDANPPTNPNYSIDVEIRFLPKSTVHCNDVTYIQNARTIDSQGRSQQNTVNAEQNARQTPLAWSIDRIAGAPSPFYIVGRTPAGRTTDVAGWGRAGRGGRRAREATLIDQPSWSQQNVATFETCAICRSGRNRGQVYGCATWGYTATSAGRVTLMPRGFRQMPSAQFEEARTAWNTWRATRPAASRPAAAPVLRSP